jgi:hypothetical protein
MTIYYSVTVALTDNWREKREGGHVSLAEGKLGLTVCLSYIVRAGPPDLQNRLFHESCRVVDVSSGVEEMLIDMGARSRLRGSVLVS